MRQYIPIFRWLQLLADLVVVQASFYGLTVRKFEGAAPEQYQTLAIISILLMIVVYQWQRVYQGFRAEVPWREARTLLKAWGILLLALALLGLGTKANIMYSREVFFTWAVAGALAQLAVHWAVDALIRRLRTRGFNRRRALFVGDEVPARELAQRLKHHHWLGIDVVGLVPMNQDSMEKTQAPPLSRLGAVENLPEIIRDKQVNLIYFTLSVKDTPRIEELMRTIAYLPVDVHWVPDLSTMDLLNQSAYLLDGQPVLCLSDSPLSGSGYVFKWLEDKILATLILLAASPLVLVIALLIKLTSPGPVFFKQKRAGQNGEVIKVYKFRSMTVHQEPEGQLTQAVKGDVRLTPLGGFLRRTSLDEFPQFFNVLQGRMSIVGPRPHAVEHDSGLASQVDAYMLRYRVKPGITGWAQVNGWRGQIDTPTKIQMRVKFDLYYINNWSISFDFLIIAMTLWHIITQKNAW